MSLIRNLAAATLGLLGCVVVASAPAQAGDFYVGFGGHHSGFGIYLDGGRFHHRDRYYDGYWREQRCTAERALFKARRMGVRHARVDYVNRREIGVVGRARGERVYVTFSRGRSCRVIG